MNRIDDQLDRLFRLVAQARPDQSAAVPPYGLETRAMAAWHGTMAGSAGFWDMTLLVRGLVVAIVIMGISFRSALNKSTDPFSEYLQLADSTVQVDNSP